MGPTRLPVWLVYASWLMSLEVGLGLCVCMYASVCVVCVCVCECALVRSVWLLIHLIVQCVLLVCLCVCLYDPALSDLMTARSYFSAVLSTRAGGLLASRVSPSHVTLPPCIDPFVRLIETTAALPCSGHSNHLP